MPLENTIVVVTGASRGLGRHIALRLGREGARVVLFARSEDELRNVAEAIEAAGGRALVCVVDIADARAVARGVQSVHDAWGPVEILVNNAGLGWHKPFVEWSLEEIDRTVDVNLKGTIYATHAVLPDMLTAGRGQILNIASDLGRRVVPNMAVYVAAKHAVVGFAGSLLREVKGRGVKVMTLTPGIVDTFFGGGTEGTRDESWSLKPQLVADLVCTMLTQPQFAMIDELSIHAMYQDF